VAGRSLYRGYRAGKHESNVNELLEKNDSDEGLSSPAMKEAAEHHAAQMNKRKKRSLIGAAGATLGAVGGGLLLGGLLGASMLTPIGWGLAAAGGLVAAGMGIHKLYRWNKKRKAGQLGVERDKHATALHTAANDPTHRDHADALKLLNARGITREQVMGDEGKDLLKRKAEAW
jgi:outer membrane lipoprotein SlyB